MTIISNPIGLYYFNSPMKEHMNKLKSLLKKIDLLTYGDIDEIESPIGPSIGESTRAYAVNKTRRKKIAELNRKVNFLNAKYPDKEFFRDGSNIKEINGYEILTTKGHDKNTSDSYLSKIEIPLLLYGLFCDYSFNEIFWHEASKSFIVKFNDIIRPDVDYVEMTRGLISNLNDPLSTYNELNLENWINMLRIVELEFDPSTMRPQVSITPSDNLLYDEKYLRLEVQHQGRLYFTNSGENRKRELLYYLKEEQNKIYSKGNTLNVTVSKIYKKPSFGIFSQSSQKIMKQHKVIEGIENRLWHRYKVVSYRETDTTAFLELLKN